MATFTVNPTTQKILKNFAGISNSLLICEGKSQKTLAEGKSMLALAEFPEAWPKETGIFDLNKFLSILSLDNKPEIEFDEEAMVLSSGPSSFNYRYSDPSTIAVPPSKILPKENPAVEFTLSEATLNRLSRVTAIAEFDMISFSVQNAGENKNVVMLTKDSKNPASHTARIVVSSEDIVAHEDFMKEIYFSAEHFRLLLEGAYTVALSSWPYGYFVHKSEPVSYFIVGQKMPGEK